ncbi:MAG: STAS-like domain-containing protein, partial [Candidatus Omnitrophica bacterium]|nr:STAS-like domain-containing protein [Candidatus Omnitrophota bacterium]
MISYFLLNEEIVLDFQGVEAATQSFVHALISEVLRQFGTDVLDRMSFKACAPEVRKIIEIV